MKVHEEAVLNGGVRSDLQFSFLRPAELNNLAPDVLVRRPRSKKRDSILPCIFGNPAHMLLLNVCNILLRNV